jgi:hypothetical protein
MLFIHTDLFELTSTVNYLNREIKWTGLGVYFISMIIVHNPSGLHLLWLSYNVRCTMYNGRTLCQSRRATNFDQNWTPPFISLFNFKVIETVFFCLPCGDLPTPLVAGQTSWMYPINPVQSLYISCHVTDTKLALSYLLLRLLPQRSF